MSGNKRRVFIKWWAWLGALALFAGLNVAVVILEPWFMRVCAEESFATPAKVAVYAYSQKPDVVFMGASVVMQGFDPRIVREELADQSGRELKVLNLGVSHGFLDINYLVMKNVITKEKAPRVVVYGVFPADFFSKRIEEEYRHAYFASFLRPNDFHLFARANGGTRLGFVAQCVLPLYRDRQLIRDFIDIELLHDRPFAAEPNARAATEEAVLSDGFRPLPAVPGARHFQMRAEGVPFIPEPWSVSRLCDIISMAQKKGSQFVLVAMPITPALRSDFSLEGQAAFIVWVKRIADRYGIPWIDLYTDSEKTFPDEDFYDNTHLNRIGAERLTRIVSRKMLTGYFSPKFSPK